MGFNQYCNFLKPEKPVSELDECFASLLQISRKVRLDIHNIWKTKYFLPSVQRRALKNTVATISKSRTLLYWVLEGARHVKMSQFIFFLPT